MTRSNAVAVVTGVGPGTGTAIARRFSSGGYKVAMLARTRERLSALEREVANAKGYPCDVTDEAQLDTALEAIRQELGTPQVLIHNAVGGAFGNFLEVDPQVLNRNFQVNTMALLHLARRLAPAMVAAGAGAIVASGAPPPFAANPTSPGSLQPRPRKGFSPNQWRENWGPKASMWPTS
jgi:NAD(P)-dependent dehydrogenase (short-subunit alcohol dehydrogenase family)